VKPVKFLVIQKVKREVPTEKWAKLLPLQFKYFDQLAKRGILEADYHLIGHQGSMLIVNADSDEALSRTIGEDPMFFHVDREVYPLTTRENHQKQIRQLLQKE
jgi:muconolactone delta-isomerase